MRVRHRYAHATAIATGFPVPISPHETGTERSVPPFMFVFAQMPLGKEENTWRGPETGASTEDWFERPLKKGIEVV
jgi:hypothetical protein